MPNDTATSDHLNLVFESVPCSRCGGDAGAFRQYGHVNQGKCLRCDGTTHALTRRGQAAVDYLNALSPHVTGDQLEVGRKYRQAGSTAPAFRVAELVDADTVKATNGLSINFAATGGLAAQTFRLLLTREERAAHVAKALAYQATLDRNGNPA